MRAELSKSEKKELLEAVEKVNDMGPETKLLWKITYKHGFTFANLYFYCLEQDIEFMFKQVASRDFFQPIELFSYELLGEFIDYEEYKPVSSSKGETK